MREGIGGLLLINSAPRQLIVIGEGIGGLCVGIFPGRETVQ